MGNIRDSSATIYDNSRRAIEKIEAPLFIFQINRRENDAITSRNETTRIEAGDGVVVLGHSAPRSTRYSRRDARPYGSAAWPFGPAKAPPNLPIRDSVNTLAA